MPMKYTCTIDLALPRDRVVALFDDPANLKRWQTNLERFEHQEGTPGQVGARSKLVYKNRNRETTMIETVTLRALPDRFVGTYEMPGVWNELDNRFEATGPGATRWTAHVEFRMESLFMKVLWWVVPGMFRKQTDKIMRQFKEFAEREAK